MPSTRHTLDFSPEPNITSLISVRPRMEYPIWCIRSEKATLNCHILASEHMVSRDLELSQKAKISQLSKETTKRVVAQCSKNPSRPRWRNRRDILSGGNTVAVRFALWLIVCVINSWSSTFSWESRRWLERATAVYIYSRDAHITLQIYTSSLKGYK
jgi:hypothetical protein